MDRRADQRPGVADQQPRAPWRVPGRREAPEALADAGRVLTCRADHPEGVMDEQVRDKALALIAVHGGRPGDALAIVERAQARIEPKARRTRVLIS